MSHVAAQSPNRKAGLWDKYVNVVGLTRLHPIIPPGARPSSKWLTYKTTPDPKQNGRCLTLERALTFWRSKHAVGKLPGVWRDDGWTPRNVQGDAAALARAYDPRVMGGYRWAVEERGGGIGVNGSELVGLDIDVVEAGASAQVVAEVRDLVPELGPGAVHRVGRAPKLLFPFRLAAGAVGFGKPSRLELGAVGAVEWLTTGQQWVLEGVHGGTGREYSWPAGRLWERGGVEALPEVDEDRAVGLLRALAKALGLRASIKRGRLPGGAGGGEVGLRETPEARAARVASLMCSEADARAMVEAVPNLMPARDERGTPREDYVAMAHFLLGCSGGAGWGRELFLWWAARYPADDPEYNEDVWDGLGQPRTGWAALMQRAERFGWAGGLRLRGRQAARAFQQADANKGGNEDDR